MQNDESKRRHLSADECRAVDRYAIEKLSIPGIVLMENAARNCADLIEKWLHTRVEEKGRRSAVQIAVVCGRGNNGGDGFAISRHLVNRGFTVMVDLAGDPDSLSGDAAVNHRITSAMGIPVRQIGDPRSLASASRRWCRCDLLVDALLGTGFEGEVREPMAGIITRINALESPLVVAVDVPSGLNADTGEPGGVAVRADRTITFLAHKAGYALGTARPYLGRVHVVDIGAPLEFILRRLGRAG